MYLETRKEQKAAAKSGWWKFLPILHTMMIVGALWIILLTALFIYMNASSLKVFFIPILFSHFIFWFLVAYWLGTRVERVKERELMGDEWFFERYPMERWLVQWNKTYRDWQIRRIQRIREERKLREENSRTLFTKNHGKREETGARTLAMRGPELDPRQLEKERKREVRAVAKREKEQRRAQKDFLKRVEREYGKGGPDLSDDAFACWCETSPEKTQFVKGGK